MNSLIVKARKIFCDSIKIKVQGGTGGPGLPKFGGIGGSGGDVYIVGSPSVRRLEAIVRSPHFKAGWFKAGDGCPALRTRLLGQSGLNLNIQVPLGVTIKDTDGQLIGQVDTKDDKHIVALGGRGGDKFNDNHGFQGQKRELRLDFKMISDAVFVGFPNAGKSSLLGAISDARPRVADFPFTTLRPYLGMIQFQDYRRIVMADLPGLVEGAHKNIGLGFQFLKHIERSRVLVFVVDVNNIDLGPGYSQRSAIETICILIKEIELYDDTILNKPSILAISKVDSLEDGPMLRKFESIKDEYTKMYNASDLSHIEESIRPRHLVKFDEILPISPLKKLGLGKLKSTVREVIDRHEESERSAKNEVSSYKELQPLENNRILQ